MKAACAGLLALLLAAPACICPLQAASAPDAAHACCTKDAPAPLPAPAKDACPSGCGHCAQVVQSPQDLPKTVASVSTPLPVMDQPSNPGTAVFTAAPTRDAVGPSTSPSPPGRAPVYLLHCALLC